MDIAELLAEREFLAMATVDKDGRPHAAPKFFLKFEKPFVYLVDYSYGRTIENLKNNKDASLCFMDLHNLEGYRLNGRTELIESGEEFERMAKEVERRMVRLSADRVIESVRTGKKHEHYELEIPNRFVILKFQVAESTRIGTRGDFFRETE